MEHFLAVLNGIQALAMLVLLIIGIVGGTAWGKKLQLDGLKSTADTVVRATEQMKKVGQIVNDPDVLKSYARDQFLKHAPGAPPEAVNGLIEEAVQRMNAERTKLTARLPAAVKKPPGMIH